MPLLVCARWAPADAQAAPEPTPRQAYDAALAELLGAQGRVDELYQAHRELTAEADRLGGDQRSISERLQTARAKARRYLADAYIAGAAPTIESSIIYQEEATNLAYKSYFVRQRSDDMHAVIAEQRNAGLALDTKSAELAGRRSANATELDQANVDLDRAVKAFRAADTRLRQSEHEAAERARADEAARAAVAAQNAQAAARTTTTAAPRPPTGGGNGASGNAQGPGWDKLRQCESGGNYGAISPGGAYRGAYQFDVRTWRGLGGSGDPATAPPAEQDRLAQSLYNQRGAQPWPICGKYLL